MRADGRMSRGRVFVLVESRSVTETFLDRDIRAYYPEGVEIISMSPSGASRPRHGRPRLCFAAPEWLYRWVSRILGPWKWWRAARRIVRQRGIGEADMLIAYWANHVFAVAYRIRRRTGCALQVCGHSRDVFVDSHLGRVPSREVQAYMFCCGKTLAWCSAVFNLDPAKLFLRTHPPPEGPSHRGHSAEEFLILNVARDVPKKNLAAVCRLINRLEPYIRAIRFRQMGADPECWQKPLHPRVSVHLDGFVTDQEVAEAMATHDLLVYGSCLAGDGDRDGVPNVLREAHAIGIPVVAEAGWANREAFTAGKFLIVESLDGDFGAVLAWIREQFPQKTAVHGENDCPIRALKC